jgi:hypothetical protein
MTEEEAGQIEGRGGRSISAGDSTEKAENVLAGIGLAVVAPLATAAGLC